jgi:antitoxin component YwqK of YwqJK toxin-antitoxin module
MRVLVSKIGASVSVIMLIITGCKEIIYYGDSDNISYIIEGNGVTKKYYENGQIAYKVKYKDKQLMRIYYVYDEKGNRLDDWEWSMDSVYVCKYRPDGSKKNCGYYVKGYKEGYWKVFTREGKKYDSVYYDNGYDTVLSRKTRMNIY